MTPARVTENQSTPGTGLHLGCAATLTTGVITPGGKLI
jgi:hypothetical protein